MLLLLFENRGAEQFKVFTSRSPRNRVLLFAIDLHRGVRTIIIIRETWNELEKEYI